ncbi:peptidase S14 [Phenylobacterium terrae]|uniref:Peptidase S14 n=1 Tax=Phenylobacterium terrae TaxID=2665495 RepID=A0ABW4N3P1_9CAUL
MPRDATPPNPPAALFAPQVRLDGRLDDDMFRTFRDALAEAVGQDGPIVVELTTMGGDADTARRIATDVRIARERGAELLFFGKAVVYSAGVNVMSAFPRKDRWLARGTSLLIHSRSIALTVNLDGPLAAERRKLEVALAQVDEGLRLQSEGFADLIAGSDVTLQELEERAAGNWYLDADAALARGLIAGVV